MIELKEEVIRLEVELSNVHLKNTDQSDLSPSTQAPTLETNSINISTMTNQEPSHFTTMAE